MNLKILWKLCANLLAAVLFMYYVNLNILITVEYLSSTHIFIDIYSSFSFFLLSLGLETRTTPLTLTSTRRAPRYTQFFYDYSRSDILLACNGVRGLETFAIKKIPTHFPFYIFFILNIIFSSLHQELCY